MKVSLAATVFPPSAGIAILGVWVDTSGVGVGVTARRPPARRPPPPAARPSPASAGTAGADMPPHPFGSRAAVRRLLALVRTHNISLLPVGALLEPGATPGPRELATEELYGIRLGGGGKSGGGGHDDDDDDDDDSGDEGESGGEAEGEE